LEEAEDDLLAGDGGISGHPQIVPGADFGAINPAILREGFLVGFEAGEIFDAAKDTLGQVGRQVLDRHEHTIEAEGDGGAVAKGVQVDVAGSGGFGTLDEGFEDSGGGRG
jgi:hypothetical protein